MVRLSTIIFQPANTKNQKQFRMTIVDESAG